MWESYLGALIQMEIYWLLFQGEFCIQFISIHHYFYMTSKIKSHRRNNAIEAFEDNNRFSVPDNYNYQPRLSNQPPQQRNNYRASDLAFSSFITKPIQNTKNNLKNHEVQPFHKKTQETIGNLMQTFKVLSDKLNIAKRQLVAKGKHNIVEVNFELNSYQNSEGNSQCDSEMKKRLQLEESTINFESNKALLQMIKSKERLIIANKIKTYYVSQMVKGTAGLNDRAIEHLNISLEIIKSCYGLNLPNQVAKKSLTADFSKLDRNSKKKILVLDLDQTLFHCFQQRNSEDDLQIILEFDNIRQIIYISLRPYAISFLKRMKQHYNIVAFTASEKCYADAILNQIDPQGELIQARLYRQHCVKLNNNIYAKDLRLIQKDLSKVVLVDNSSFSCLYQLENSVPMIPYYGGEDSELLSLQKYLQQLSRVQDIRKLNTKTFKLNRYRQFDDNEQLVRQLYCNI